MAVLDRPQGYSLWMSSLLPSDNASWELMAVSDDYKELERAMQSLKFIAVRRRLAVMEGQNSPPWRPKL